MSNKKADIILKKYAALYQSLKRAPTMPELSIACKLSKDTIRHYYSSLSALDKIARQVSPDSFFDIGLENILLNKKNYTADVNKVIKNYKRFVITTAVSGCELDINFYKSIKTYCQRNNALLLILVSADPASTAERDKFGYIDNQLQKELIIAHDVELNSNLFISNIKLSAKHIDPITGLGRIGQRNGSFIFASPKQRLHMVATSNVKLPHALMTTGAITKPNYQTERYMSERTAYIAQHDHIMGAIIVEVANNNEFHFRQIQATSDGAFIDLGHSYSHDKMRVEHPAALVLGDWHSGETDPVVVSNTIEMVKFLQPKHIVLHDAFNGLSINHHEEHAQISKAKRAMHNKHKLEDEIERLTLDIEEFIKLNTNVVVVKSNHDEFLCKHYLQYGKYTQDPQNHRYALPLAIAMLDGIDPLKYAVENKLSNEKYKNNIIWLKRDDDFCIASVQLGAHGDKGSNGSRGSLHSMESAYGNCVTGHSHTPGILRGAWAVGTSSLLKLNYNTGPSSWLQAHCIVYSNGSRQLINIVNGKWRMQ